MIRHLIAGLVAASLISGCASDPRPKPSFKDGTRIGIVNSLESNLTHQHISIDRISSFSKQIKVGWEIPAYLETRLTEILEKDKRFDVVPIRSAPIQPQLKQLSDQIDAAAERGKMSQNLIDFIENLTKVDDLDVIIIAQSFRGQSPWKIGNSPYFIQGYGLLTRSTMLSVVGLKRNWAHPYAQIRIVVFGTRPVSRIGVGSPELAKRNMGNFNWPADIKNVPPSELDKLRPTIQDFADQAVKNALQSAQMAAGP